MIAAKIDPVEMEVSKYFVAAAASNETREDALSMVKDPDVVDGVFLVGKQDGNFLDEDVEPEADPDSDSGESEFFFSSFFGVIFRSVVLVRGRGAFCCFPGCSGCSVSFFSAASGKGAISLILLTATGQAQRGRPKHNLLPPPPTTRRLPRCNTHHLTSTCPLSLPLSPPV